MFRIKLFVNIYCRKFRFESCKCFRITTEGVNFSFELLQRIQTLCLFRPACRYYTSKSICPICCVTLNTGNLKFIEQCSFCVRKDDSTSTHESQTNSEKIILAFYSMKNLRCMVPSLIIFPPKKIRVKSLDFWAEKKGHKSLQCLRKVL